MDGRPVNLDFLNIVLRDFIPNNVADIRQIEVIRGPASAVWGTNAMTGVVNIITKSPREAPGTAVSLSGGFFDRNAGPTIGKGVGSIFAANAAVSEAPNARWSYRVSAGYFQQDALPRPTGQIPLIQDPRASTVTVGGASYPADAAGSAGSAFLNAGTSQPKFNARVDEEIEGGRLTFEGGVAGTSGILHSGVGPFDIQRGSYAGYGSVAYAKGMVKAHLFANVTNASAPNLLLTDPATLKPLQLDFSTQTYDAEASDAIRVGTRQVITIGGNVRRNNYDITIAPAAENRTEAGTYVQDEAFLGRLRLTLGARVDKFGNLGHPVFAPRVADVFMLKANQSIRLSFNRAFRAPSAFNNYLDTKFVVPTDLSALAPLLPPALQPAVVAPFPLIVGAVGSQVPINGTSQKELKEESITAYEVGYTGTFAAHMTVGLVLYVNDISNDINFSQLDPRLDPYTATSPPPGWTLPPAVLTLLGQRGVFLPRTAFSYLNLGPLRQKGAEVSADYRVNRGATAFANYSWQAMPTILDDPNPFPATELSLPPANRFNLGVNVDGDRLLGSISVSHSDRAFWSDVLSSPFYGYTKEYTTVDASVGVKWSRGRLTTLVKTTNLFNQDIQQHVFGDILKRSVVAEVRLKTSP